MRDAKEKILYNLVLACLCVICDIAPFLRMCHTIEPVSTRRSTKQQESSTKSGYLLVALRMI